MKQAAITFTVLFFSSIIGHSQAEYRSIHQEQSEAYSKYNYTSEQQWDDLRFQNNGISSALGKNNTALVCALNKRVYGWNPYWAGSAYQNYDWELLSDLCHFSYEVVSTTGQASSTHNWLTDAAVTAAQANGVKVSLCATLFSNHATFLTNAASKQTFITNIISLVQQRNGSGCNIDFEGVPAAQSANLTAFMIDLCNQMHTAIPNSEISIALPAVDWNAVYDVNAMKNYVDLFIIMGYDYYWGGSTTAGPTDPLYNFDTSYNYTLTKSITYYLKKNIPNVKLLLALPYYGREYITDTNTIPSPVVSPPNSITRFFNFVKNNLNGNYVTLLWDSISYTPYYIFNTSNWNQCFINNGYSMGKRFDVVNQFGIGGIGIWALGYDDGYPDFWNKIRDKFSDCGIIPCTDTIFDMGGPNRNYFDNEKYTYTIAPSGASVISMAFSAFNAELNYDSLWIYNGATTASPLIGSYTGTNSPGTVNAAGSSLTIRWKSDGATKTSGWYAVWNCTQAVGLNELAGPAALTVYPNPSTGEFTVYSLQATIELSVYDVLGNKVLGKTQNYKQGTINLKEAPSGIYFIHVKTGHGVSVVKIIKE